MGFPTGANRDFAVAVAGDFATSNPRRSYPSGEADYVAGAAGVTVARFAWIQADNRTVLNAAVATEAPQGLIHRDMQAQIGTYLAETSNVIQAGREITIMQTGDYYIKATVGAATRGQKAFAKLTDGTMQAAAAGATVAGFVETPFTITLGCLVGELAIVSL